MAVRRIETGHCTRRAVKAAGAIFIAGPLAYEKGGADVAFGCERSWSRSSACWLPSAMTGRRSARRRVWLADIADCNKVNTVWDASVPRGQAPARPCVEAKLAMSSYLVEVVATACAAD